MNPSLYVKSLRFRTSRLRRESYIHSIKALQSFNELSFTTPVTFLVGKNGSGKSTLLEAIAVCCGFDADGGTLNFRIPSHLHSSTLAEVMKVQMTRALTPSSFFFRGESFFNRICRLYIHMCISEPPQRDNRQVIHKTPSMESLLTSLANTMGPGLYFMDEPEIALSAQAQLALYMLMEKLAKNNDAQFIIATHSPILLAMPGATILHMDDDGITPVSFEDTESYQITELMINRLDSMLGQID